MVASAPGMEAVARSPEALWVPGCASDERSSVQAVAPTCFRDEDYKRTARCRPPMGFCLERDGGWAAGAQQKLQLLHNPSIRHFGKQDADFCAFFGP